MFNLAYKQNLKIKGRLEDEDLKGLDRVKVELELDELLDKWRAYSKAHLALLPP
jgi:hypothetical protein